MDDIVLIKEPVFTVGALVQHSPTDHITSSQWGEHQSMNFGQMCSLATGFTAEGIFVKSYEALWDDDGEVCIILLDIGLEFTFRTLRRGLTDEMKAFAETLKIPDFEEEIEGRRMSFGDIIKSTESVFVNHADSFGSSASHIRLLWNHLRYIHEIRNMIIHRKNIVRSVIWEAIQEKKTGYPNPNDYGITIEKDLENLRHKKPYWWRILSTIWYSAIEINQIVLLFKARFLNPIGSAAVISRSRPPDRIGLRRLISRLRLKSD